MGTPAYVGTVPIPSDTAHTFHRINRNRPSRTRSPFPFRPVWVPPLPQHTSISLAFRAPCTETLVAPTRSTSPKMLARHRRSRASLRICAPLHSSRIARQARSLYLQHNTNTTRPKVNRTPMVIAGVGFLKYCSGMGTTSVTLGRRIARLSGAALGNAEAKKQNNKKEK